MRRRINWESQHVDELDEDDDVYDDENETEGMESSGKMMLTPYGMFNVNDKYGNPYRQFDLWVGHTNFPIDKQTVFKISETPGVEVLKIMTPYRFIMAAGKMFDSRDVRLLVQKRICTNKHEDIIAKLDESIKNEVDTVLDALQGEDFWRMYVFPNGQIYHKSYSGLSQYETGKQEFADLKKASSGVIITSD